MSLTRRRKREGKWQHILLALGLGLLAAGVCGSVGAWGRCAAPAARAQGPDGYDTYYVASSCAGVPAPCFTTVQAAVDAADDPGDVVKVATGVYTGVNDRGGLSQVVYVSKTVTVRGSYTTTNWSASYPLTQPTTLDAEGQGRVMYITGDISPTVEGLHITGGDAIGLGGGPVHLGTDGGGGIYVNTASAIIKGNQVFGNTPSRGFCSAIYLYHSDATISENVVTTNIGRQLCLDHSDATITGNTISHNIDGVGSYLWHSDATLNDNIVAYNHGSHGAGLYLDFSDATLINNTIISNTARIVGGGLYIVASDATFISNTIAYNTAEEGGGLLLGRSDVTLSDNLISHNVADSHGGGLCLYGISNISLSGNTISHSAASLGGGLCSFSSGGATLTGNTIANNSADNSGGLLLGNATLINNIIADNWAERASGADIWNAHLLHNTIARNNGGDGVGIDTGGSVMLTNTVIVSQSIGIAVRTGDTATLEGTLWGDGAWANETDWGGAGTILTGTVNVWGDPAFVDPDAGDYHIGPGSAAIDAGVSAGVDEDIDGEPRPAGVGPDAGADEFPATLSVVKRATPDPVQPGTPLTYTIHVTNTGNVTLTTTVTDVLPDHVAPAGSVTWAPDPLAPGRAWAETLVVTAGLDYAGPLTNVVRAAAAEAASGIYTRVVTLAPVPGVALAPDRAGLANPGTVVTYVHTLTNTGSGPDTFDLAHASSQGWAVACATPLSLGRGQSATVVVSVTVPAGGGGLTDVSTIIATSQADASVRAAVADTTVANVAPVADAGPDQTVAPGDAVLLDGGGSVDPDGHLPLAYLWRHTGGPPVALAGAGTAQAAFEAPPHPAVLTFTLAVTDALELGSDPDAAVVRVREEPRRHPLYLPLLMRNRARAPDLVVERIVATTGDVWVAVGNRGDAPVSDPFWVDVYIDPDPVPTAPNQVWYDGRCEYGLVWGLTGPALRALAPGGVLTLTVGDAYYWPALSRFPDPLPAGTPVYAQVDAANLDTDYGGVLESHEIWGGVYNNVAGPVYVDGMGE